MKKQTRNDKLAYDIALLELKRDQEFRELNAQFHTLYESMKPVNMIKGAIKEITGSGDAVKNVSSAAIGVTSGYLLKKILFRPTLNPLKMLAGVVLQTVATNMAAKHSEEIKSSGLKLLKVVMAKIIPKKKAFSETEIYE